MRPLGQITNILCYISVALNAVILWPQNRFFALGLLLLLFPLIEIHHALYKLERDVNAILRRHRHG